MPDVTAPNVSLVLSSVIAGVIVNGSALDVPPTGAGLTTVTLTVPVAPMSLAGMTAWSCPLLTNVVARAAPFQRIWEPFTKWLPVTVRVKPAPPTVAPDGDRLVSTGTGLARYTPQRPSASCAQKAICPWLLSDSSHRNPVWKVEPSSGSPKPMTRLSIEPGWPT